MGQPPTVCIYMSQRIPHFLTSSFLRGIIRGVGAAEDLGPLALSGQLFGVPCISEVCFIIFGCIYSEAFNAGYLSVRVTVRLQVCMRWAAM